jgi:hypothetical protein
MDKFRVGQKVRFVGLVKQPEDNGKITTIVAQQEKFVSKRTGKLMFGYEVTGGYGVKEINLEPVYDGDEKSSWSESAWKPNKVKA